MLKVYIEYNEYFGTDSKGKNIMIYAFQPLKVLQKNDVYSVVKPIGKGNYRSYLIRNDKIIVC